MKKILMLVFGTLALTSCSTIFKWQTEHPDNFAEELLEDAIDNYTGYEIDLTPLSGEETYDNIQKEKK